MNPAASPSQALRWNPDASSYETCDAHELHLSIHDVGALYGALVVERLRTFGGHLHPVDLHWERFQRGMKALGISLPLNESLFRESLLHVLDANREWCERQRDVSLIAVATPGVTIAAYERPTSFLYLSPLPWDRLAEWYRHGTALITAAWRNGAGDCWPSDIKTRNRLPYYLADREAQSRVMQSIRHPLALLPTSDGSVGDTSVANLIIVTNEGEWVTPETAHVLAGTTLQRSESLLRQHGVSLEYRKVDWAEIRSAREVLLLGNSGCVWHASTCDGISIGNGTRGNACAFLQKLWVEFVAFDWLGQVN